MGVEREKKFFYSTFFIKDSVQVSVYLTKIIHARLVNCRCHCYEIQKKNFLVSGYFKIFEIYETFNFNHEKFLQAFKITVTSII